MNNTKLERKAQNFYRDAESIVDDLIEEINNKESTIDELLEKIKELEEKIEELK